MPPLIVNLENLPAVMNKKFYPDVWDKHRHLVEVGGAGSGKSRFAAMKCLVRMMTEPRVTGVVLRKIAATNRLSTWENVCERIYENGWQNYYDMPRSVMTITFKPNGSRLHFRGLDNQEKLKSIESPNFFWLEEATEFTEADIHQVNLRVRGINEFYPQIMYTTNPISIYSPIKRIRCDIPATDTKAVHSTYLDNRFLDDSYIEQLKKLEQQDATLYKIYTLGLWGTLKGLIYTNFPIEEGPEHADETFWGIDFGYNHPTVVMEISRRDDVNYWREIIYESELITSDLMDRMTELGLPKAGPYYADSAEPDRIAEMRRAGWNVKRAKKGPGSVRAGILFVKKFQNRISPDSVNTQKEIQTYKWAEDKNGILLEEPIKYADDGLDAGRYAIMTHMKSRRKRTVIGG